MALVEKVQRTPIFDDATWAQGENRIGAVSLQCYRCGLSSGSRYSTRSV
jgi:hypothetical protein